MTTWLTITRVAASPRVHHTASPISPVSPLNLRRNVSGLNHSVSMIMVYLAVVCRFSDFLQKANWSTQEQIYVETKLTKVVGQFVLLRLSHAIMLLILKNQLSVGLFSVFFLIVNLLLVLLSFTVNKDFQYQQSFCQYARYVSLLYGE